MLNPGWESTVQTTDLNVAVDIDSGVASWNLASLGVLRPCVAQVVFPHHACIDLLPLPGLREMAVKMPLSDRIRQDGGGGGGSSGSGSGGGGGGAKILPPHTGFDRVQELKRDVYLRQGIRFRGTGELGPGEVVGHDEYESGRRHCGHPWERASWAVAPWFARKWKRLVDT